MSVLEHEVDRAEIERAYDHTLAIQAQGNWKEWLLTLTEDAVYGECEVGILRGREAIGGLAESRHGTRKQLDLSGALPADRGKPRRPGWWNRLPGARPDGSHYEFMGTSYKVYDGNGLLSYHEDVYNLKQGIEVIKEWTAAQEG